MKLYVWEKVNCDWTCGMIVVLAASDEEARQHLNLKEGTLLIDGQEPTITDVNKITDPQSWSINGGS